MNTEFTAEFLSGLYRQMITIRAFEESLVDPILTTEIRTPCHLSSGQEAVAVGICAGLTRDDYVFGSHRSHGHYLAKGGDLRAMMAEIYCKAAGCSRGRGGSMHVIDRDAGMMGSAPIVAGTIPLAVGAALAAQIRAEKRVAVSFFGDGACGEGVLYESLNFAALKRLPVIFACENNLYSTHMPISECRVNTPIYLSSASFGVESHQVDGNDVLQVLSAARAAINACRNGKGPVFLELMTYRLRGHVGPDDDIQGSHQDIRPQSEIEAWRKKDPIPRFERYLLAERILDQYTMDSIRAEVAAEIGQARAYAMQSANPRNEDLLTYVFA